MKKRILLLCLFCMTLGFAYSQEPDPQITNMTKVVICTSDKKSLIKAESLKEIWKPAYIHTISISPKANLKALIRLEELLQKTPMLYNPENTLIICTVPRQCLPRLAVPPAYPVWHTGEWTSSCPPGT